MTTAGPQDAGRSAGGLVCEGLRFAYPARPGRVETATAVLDGVSFRLFPGELLCIVGASGCGKTTLLKLLAGLLTPSEGRIAFDDGDRSRIAVVFQRSDLFPWRTVGDNVAYPLEVRGLGRVERERLAGETLNRVGLKGSSGRYPHELSVGMAQRASLARALVSNPAFLLMDEPFASVDALTRRLLQQDLLAIWRERQNSIVFVTHDIAEAVFLGDRVLVQSAVGGIIAASIPVDIERPRRRGEPRAVEIELGIWALLEKDVRSAGGRVE